MFVYSLKDGDNEEDGENSSDPIEEQLFKNERNRPLPDRKGHFPCDNPLCTLVFKTARGYEFHQGKNQSCKIPLRTETIESWIQNKWIKKFGIPTGRVSSYRQSRKLVTHMGSLKIPKTMPSKKLEQTYEGCAKRKEKKAPKRLNNNQKKYLYDIFAQGFRNKRKARAYDVEKQMRRYKEDGKSEYYFTSEEWLSEKKIKGAIHKQH